ncbi:hypothetical protein [Halomonas sp. MMSF_3323]|uniref:hypothetical protein n=1 Tax=Halomonas sp. MMSF_3323 TaxID=3046701 RepID=UPI00273FD8CB|nr:hypothetical protein [Halomonas sp. MMSF_3323]
MKDKKIERHNQICRMAEQLLNFDNKKVYHLYRYLNPMIGYRATILLLCIEQRRSVSTEEIKFIGEVLGTLSNKSSFNVPLLTEQPLSFELVSQLKSFKTRLGNSYFISAKPQYKWDRNSLNDGSKSYEIDLLLELYFVYGNKNITIAKVALEYDGPFHLQEKTVRSDKFRDAFIQSSDIPVFRLPSQNSHFPPQQGREEFATRLDIYKSNINDFICNRIYDYESHILNERSNNSVNEINSINLASDLNDTYL